MAPDRTVAPSRLWTVNEFSPKEEVRNRFRGLRRSMGADRREAEMASLCAHLVPWLQANAPRRTVTCFLSYGAEPPTGGLLRQLDAAGFTVFVPICEPERRLSWTRWFPGVEMARSAVGPIDEPVGERFGQELMGGIDVVLVPAQAVDVNGDRLGQGGGYYDRFIASLQGPGRRPRLASILFEHEFVAAGQIPVEPLDERVETVVLPSGVRNLTS